MDDKTIFYIVGSALTALAVIVSFIGIRDKQFPPSGPLKRVILGVFAALVLVTAAYAVLSAREEQAERREHLAQAFEEAADEAIEQPAQEPAVEEPGGPAGNGEAADGETAEGGTEEGAGGGDEGGDELETLGAEVFSTKGCGSCHTLAAADATGTIGPNLDETLDERDDEFIRTSVVDPDADLAAGFEGVMPAFTDLSDRELDALVAFLKFSSSMN